MKQLLLFILLSMSASAMAQLNVDKCTYRWEQGFYAKETQFYGDIYVCKSENEEYDVRVAFVTTDYEFWDCQVKITDHNTCEHFEWHYVDDPEKAWCRILVVDNPDRAHVCVVIGDYGALPTRANCFGFTD